MENFRDPNFQRISKTKSQEISGLFSEQKYKIPKKNESFFCSLGFFRIFTFFGDIFNLRDFLELGSLSFFPENSIGFKIPGFGIFLV